MEPAGSAGENNGQLTALDLKDIYLDVIFDRERF
jgi:hypothetical protein